LQHAEEPRPPDSQKLTGGDRYRIRRGFYRIVYEIEDRRLVVLMIKIARRGPVYHQA